LRRRGEPRARSLRRLARRAESLVYAPEELANPDCDRPGAKDFVFVKPSQCGFVDWGYRSFNVADDMVFVQARVGPIFVHDGNTGKEVARLSAGPEASGAEGPTDNPILGTGLVAATKRANGEYLVTKIDTSSHARTLLMRWKPKAFSPESLAPLAWYRAAPMDVMYDDVTGRVVRWHDRSGNGRDLLQASSTHRPTYSPTGWNGDKPTVVFDGTTSVLERNPWPTENPIGDGEPYTVLAVVKPTEVRDASIATWWGTGGLVGAWLEADGGEVMLRNLRVGGSSDDHEFTGTTDIATNRRVLAFRLCGRKVPAERQRLPPRKAPR
jgi:hypothetical protein